MLDRISIVNTYIVLYTKCTGGKVPMLQEIPFKDSTPDVPEFYVDATRIGIGLYTILLQLGQQLPVQPGTSPGQLQARTVAMVRMSPQHALVLTKLLEKNLKEYQKRFGRNQSS